MSAVLADALGAVLGATVTDLTRLTGGASRTTWAFKADERPLILRTGPPDELHASMELEAAVQKLAGAQGAPVPHILAASNSVEPLGNPYLICSEIPGETIVRKIFRGLDDAGRAALLAQCADALADIHRADPAGAGLSSEDQLGAWRAELDAMHDTTATFEWAFRWLERNRPASRPATLVHGDFRMGNLVIDGSRLAAVLDWELTHAGDPCEDLAWFCIRAWRFGAPKSLGAGGLGSIEDFLTAYEHTGDRTVDRDEFRWWLVLATLRWGVICRFQAERHLSGQSPSVELATIGRRVCETEWDLLNLIDPDHAGAFTRSKPTESHPDPSGVLHGRPTAAELVAAVADFLDTDVRGATDGQVNYHARVAANALRMVQRELDNGSSDEASAALSKLCVTDEAELATAIRRGDLDDRADDLMPCLRVLVSNRLAAAHPSYQEE
ncbi:phosphotransferase family protein [Mycobacterium sp. OTB74]|uniref:phosphotransferase family protein n=1 Tax=Mycobacterium sp. OTB74 TaxID=1853452 RepID=UPI0024733DE5|nr:phosphotransferase family protein [Mycobacterium sp. OTB74]MDH6242630.1 aminoglycoside phosphotransferase (APT) family kinase protein [Mycobacterium sp. OTB74]